MRIYIKLTKNNKVIPFNYQQFLTGTIHKWLGNDNKIHGNSAKFSFSWLQNTSSTKEGINLNLNSYFFISANDENILKKIIRGIIEDPSMFSGIKARDIQIVNTPQFESPTRFLMASPVLLKYKEENSVRHVTVNDSDFEQVLNLNLKKKLQKAGIPENNFKIRLDPNSYSRKTKLITYKEVENKTSLAPVIIEGTQEQIAFVWNVGLGNSTGIGFGALK